MLGSSSARIRQILIMICLACIFLLSLIIMGTVGVNGKVTFRSLNKGCLLYMSIDGEVTSYNNGYCLFPIVGAAVAALIALLSMIYLAMVLRRRDEFSPKPLSMIFLVLSGLLALLSFSICGEIGIGLNKGCKILGDQRHHCRSSKNFSALYGAQICAGLMGGFWLVATLLELFQLKGRPKMLSNSVDHLAQTTVVPNRASNHPSHDQYYDHTYHQQQQQQYQQPQMTQPTGYSETHSKTEVVDTIGPHHA